MSAEGGPGRREFLRGAGVTLSAGAGGLALLGCGRKVAITRNAVKRLPRPVQRSDVRILNAALDLERRTVAAYTAGIPLLSKAQVKTARQFLNEELQHTGELLYLIKTAGGNPIPRAASYDLGHPRDEHAVIVLLHELEATQIRRYLDAIPQLSPGPLRAAVASILASDAQHVAILRLTQGLVPAPSAFVTGRE